MGRDSASKLFTSVDEVWAAASAGASDGGARADGASDGARAPSGGMVHAVTVDDASGRPAWVPKLTSK